MLLEIYRCRPPAVTASGSSVAYAPRPSVAYASGSERCRTVGCFLAALLLGLATPPTAARASSAERIRFVDAAGEKQEVVAESLVTAQDGGRMVLTDEGRMFIIQPEDVVDSSALEAPMQPIDAAEAGRRLLEELPPGFSVYRTRNYVIVHNTQDGYVRWVGGLFEALHRGFYAYFKNQGWKLDEPRFPLVAVVFSDRAGFDAFAGAELGDTAKSVIGYFHLETNRMITFAVPNAERNIATIIHEATHQLAYNTGVQTRFADNPMWVSEGLAVFFESPNFATPSGWRGIGRVNQLNLARFRKYAPSRPPDSLVTLLSDDTRFREASTAEAAYAEAWALTYFLLRTRKKQYVEYLRELSRGEPLIERGRRERIEMFERIFETDLATLDRQFMTYMARVQ